MVSRDSIRQVLLRMERNGVAREDLQETFIRGGGSGGQKINKTSSTVRLRHLPTGIEVRCQEERSLSQNRYLARITLCERLEALLAAGRQQRSAAVFRLRAQKVCRSPSAKRKIVAGKRMRGQIKSGRRRPQAED